MNAALAAAMCHHRIPGVLAMALRGGAKFRLGVGIGKADHAAPDRTSRHNQPGVGAGA